MSKSIQKKYQDSINNYANEVQSLERFVDIVRKMPGMYIGPVGLKGLINMFREILQNSVDQMMRVDSPCTHIIISFDETTCTFIIEDNGFGIPFGMMVDIFSKQHVSSNYEKTPFKFTSGRHGIGSKVTNMLCEFFQVESFVNGVGHAVSFEEGLLKEDEHEIPNPDNKQGTIVTFRPSEYIWQEGLAAGIQESLSVEELLAFVQSLVPQTNIGDKIVFNAVKSNGQQVHEVLINEDGIYTHLYAATTTPLINPIHLFDNTDGTHKAEIAFTFDITSSISPYIVSFANTCPVTNKSTHVVGFEDGLVKWFRKYMNNVFLAGKKGNKIQVTANDIKQGLICAMSVFHLNPNFEGQAKDALANADMVGYISQLVVSGLEAWSKAFPKDLNKVCQYLKDVAELRLKTEQGKIKLSDKYEASGITSMPKKYTQPSGKEHLEFWIVEGDSANGMAKLSRCPVRQGVMPIRGKIANALTTERSKLLANAEVAAIITVVGGGYGRSFDLSKVKWEKIVFGADA